mmetsp:Transcript_26954/g.62621  ORF Transcript_26954/g.62621 Transcript_26954/m.62621 type:complete len:207 (+) Transcript_26954:1269-1889(+)
MHNYNTTQEPLILKEYGRNIQKLVSIIHTIDKKVTRTSHAQRITQIMAILSASNRHTTDNAQKRWGDLFIISNYTLDVDSPYPVPEKITTNKNLQRLTYNTKPIQFKSYGRNVEHLVHKAVEMQDSQEQEKMIINIIRLMKAVGNMRNHNNVDENTLFIHLKHIAGDKLMIDFEKLKEQYIATTAHGGKNGNLKVTRSMSKKKRNL